MAKAKTTAKAPRILPGAGGTSTRDKSTGELRPRTSSDAPAQPILPIEEE